MKLPQPPAGLFDRMRRTTVGKLALLVLLGHLTQGVIESARMVVDLHDLIRGADDEAEDVVPAGGRDASVDDEPYAAPPG